MNYAARLIAGTLLVLVITVGTLVIGVDRSLRRDLEGEARRSLIREAELIQTTLGPDSLTWQATAKAAARVSGLRVTIIDRTGRVRAESDLEAAELANIENHATRPEVIPALRGDTGSDQRTSATVGRRFMYVAVPGGPGAIRTALSLGQVDDIVSRAQRPVLVAALLALLIGVPLALVAGRRFARPLADIALAARNIARGEHPTFPFSGIPDVDRLANDLRGMHEQLSDRFDALRRRQSETAAIVDSMVEGVLSFDERGRVVTANPAARRMLGYGEQDELPELGLLFRAKEPRELLDRVLTGETVADREISLGDRTYLLNARPLPTGGSVVVLHDLTRLRRLETVRRDFVANVSHELKTPLTAISGYAETLLTDQPEPAISRQFLETILANARRMQRLVDDQLDLSRIESGGWEPAPEPVDLPQVAREAWRHALQPGSPEPTFTVRIDDAVRTVDVDPDALRQVFRNLFENAVRHTPAGGSITVTGQAEKGLLHLAVADTGIGIASEHLPRIFERFYRVDPGRSRAQGGTGLGLAIVKHLVEAHGGRVEAASDLGHGTTIHTWWPIQPA